MLAKNFSNRERRRLKRLGGRSTAKMEPRTIAITRPVGKGGDTAELVRSLGWTPFIFHTVELKPLDDRKIIDQIRSSLTQGQIDWIVFMSSTGVKLLFDVLASYPHLPRIPPETRFMAVGPRTRETLLRYGIPEALVPKNYSSAGVDEWFGQLDPKHLRIDLGRLATRPVCGRSLHERDFGFELLHNSRDEIRRYWAHPSVEPYTRRGGWTRNCRTASQP